MNKRYMVVGLLALLLLFSSIAIWLGNSNVKENVKNISNEGVRYATHGVIRINSNKDFKEQASQEGWPGDGSQSNPYVISGYDIDAHGAGDAIYIGNTTVYFVVENCYLHNASEHSAPYFEGDGITLYIVTNGTISGNKITNNGGDGIFLDSSSSNTLSGNNITDNTWGSSTYSGIELWGSSSNTLSGNNISDNEYGIYLIDSSNNTIYNDLISNNTNYGIYIINKYSSSSYNLIYNNSFYYNHRSGDTFNSQCIQAKDTGSHNYWNTSGIPHGYGNYWHDWANNNDTNDNNNNGIVDWPYKIDGGPKDYYPLKNSQPVPEFSTGIWLFIIILIALLGVIRFRSSS